MGVISSTLARRPMGWRAMKSFSAWTGSADAAIRPRSDGVSTVPGQRAFATQALFDEIGCDRFRQPDDGSLRRAIRCPLAKTLDRGCHRRHVQYRSRPRLPCPLQHARHECSAHAHHGGHIQVKRKGPVCVGDVEHCSVVNDAGAVEKTVQFRQFRRQSVNLNLFRNIKSGRPDA